MKRKRREKEELGNSSLCPKRKAAEEPTEKSVWKRKLIKVLNPAKVNSGMCCVEEVMLKTLGNA